MRQSLCQFLLIVSAIAAHCVQNAQCSAAEDILNDLRNIADFVSAGYQDGRAKLKSGQFHISGRLDRSSRRVDPVDGPITMEGMFDAATGALRIKREQPFWTTDASGKRLIKQLGGMAISTPDARVEWRTDEAVAYVYRPVKPLSNMVRPVDIRVIGISSWGTLDEGINPDGIVRAILQMPVLEARLLDNGIYHIAVDYPGIGTRQDTWFDSSKDFAPIKYELRQRNPKNEGPWDLEHSKPFEYGDASWEKLKDVWVPTSMKQRIEGKEPDIREWNIEWISVNEPISPAEFTWQGLPLPKNTRVVDMRERRPVSLSPTSQQGLGLDNPIDKRSKGSVLLYTNLALIVVLAAWLIFRKFASRQ